MSPRELEQLKALIRMRIGQLTATLDQQGEPSDQHQQQRDDDAASLDITINSTVQSQLLDHTRRELAQLHGTLAWLDGDDAGYCDRCGREIPLARLKAVPATRLCVTCADK